LCFKSVLNTNNLENHCHIFDVEPLLFALVAEIVGLRPTQSARRPCLSDRWACGCNFHTVIAGTLDSCRSESHVTLDHCDFQLLL